MNKLIERKGEFVYLAIADNLSKQKQEIESSREVLEGLYATWLKLAEYEDIGMIPNEIRELIKEHRENEAIISKMAKRLRIFEERMLESGIKTEGLLIRLPCNVGDEAVIVFDEYGELFITTGWEVSEITITHDDVILDFRCYATNEVEERSLKDFGRTVFLTE